MSFPTVSVQLALSTRPTETATWVDFTSRCYAVEIRRGRQHELDRSEAGTCRLILDNTDRLLDPTYTGAIGNYLPNPSFEVDTAGWTSTGTLVRSNTQTKYGSYSGEVTNIGLIALTTYSSADTGSPLAANIHYGLSAWFYGTAGIVGGSILLELVESGGVFGSEVFAVSATQIIVAGWQQISCAGMLKRRDSTAVSVRLYQTGLGGNVGYWDAIMLERAASVSSSYCDGDQAGSYWTGTAHASTSFKYSAYYGDLLPMRRVRVRATWPPADPYDIFHGFIESYGMSWPTHSYGIMEIRATDGLGVLAKKILNTSYVQQSSDARINAVLDDASWTGGNSWVLDSATNSRLPDEGGAGGTTILSPNGDRDVRQGNSTILASTLANVTALQHIQDVSTTEYGLVFIKGDGSFAFYNRHYKNQPDMLISKGTFGDDISELLYTDYKTSYDSQYIYNDIRMQNTGGAVQTATDATSKLDYFPRTLAQESLLGTSNAEASDRANWMLSRLKDPHYRVLSVSFQNGDDNLWSQILGRELWDRITVNRRPQGGTVFSQDYLIEGMQHSIKPGQTWETVWQLTMVDPTAYWLVCGDAADSYAPYAVLGTSTILGY